MRLTIARYYTPSGRCIQKKYEMGNTDAYDQDIYNRYMHGEFDSADSIKMDDSLKYQTVGGRTVYGGAVSCQISLSLVTRAALPLTTQMW